MPKNRHKKRPIQDVMSPAKRGSNFTQGKSFTINIPPINKYVSAVIVVVAVIIIGSVVLVVHHNDSSSTGPSSQSQITKTVDEVNKLMLLPTGEQPTLAIVNDASKYDNTSFFKNAADGDRLLIYAQAREAILYRPSINKIIAVAQLNPSP
jgi:hypothetical protein